MCIWPTEKQMINYLLCLQDRGSSLGCGQSMRSAWGPHSWRMQEVNTKAILPWHAYSHPLPVSFPILCSLQLSLDHRVCFWPAASTILRWKRGNQPHTQHWRQDAHRQVLQSCWPTRSSHWFTFCPYLHSRITLPGWRGLYFQCASLRATEQIIKTECVKTSDFRGSAHKF